MIKSTRLRRVAAVAAVALMAAACGGGEEEPDAGGESSAAAEGESEGGEGGGGALGEIDLSGADVTVGSKDFTEQLVLGEIYVQALEAAGASVTNQVNLGGTSVAREALLAGEIDVYPEYNGTGWTVHLGNEDPSFDATELTENVREADLEANDIAWVGLAPFNDTYGFAMGSAFVEENGELDLQGMADHLEQNPDATVCMESEFPSRPDGLVLFEDATGYEVPESQQNILDTAIIYNETANGTCDFGEIFTTDGRIAALDLTVVEDPGVFILYNISATMQNSVYSENQEAYDELFAAIHEPLTEERMAELNGLVAVEGEDAADVATQYLEEEGLVAGG